jgi:SAM-dependent methyltransferase
MGGSGDTTAWAQNVQHACPRCRAAIDLTEAGGRCPACGFIVTRAKGIYGFLGEVEAIDEWQSTFDDLASGKRGHTSAGLGFRSSFQHRYLIEAFRQACGAIPADARILDVGCGNGIFREALFNRRRVVGVDYSLNMCILAHARSMTAYQANALALPFADGQFDLVYSSELAQCITDLSALLTEFARVCDTGGRIVVSTINATSLVRRGLQAARTLRPHPVWGANRPVIMRTAADIAVAARGLPLKLDMVYWTHFPLPWLRPRASVHNLLAWAASNVIIRFVKQAPLP